MTETPPPAPAPADSLEHVQDLCRRAVQGDAAVLPELRHVLDGHPEMWHAYGDLAVQAQAAWVNLTAGPDLLLHESLQRFAEQMKSDLAGDDPSALERLLVERVAATWLQVNHADAAYAQAKGPGATVAVMTELQKRQESASRSHLAAVKQLALVRKLLKPAPSPLDLLRATAETTTAKPRYQGRREKGVAAGVPVEN